MYAFSLLIGLGAVLGLIGVVLQAPVQRNETAFVQHFYAGLLVCLGGLVGGRVAFVILNWPYFQGQPWAAWQVFRGGLVWPGVMAGGLITLLIYAAVTHQAPGSMADALLPLVAALAVSAWLGCWLDGCAYGPQTQAWWGVLARDELGQVSRRLPTQLLGALLVLELFWLLDRNWKWYSRSGTAACLGLMGLSLEIFVLSFLRVDPASLWYNLRLEAWAALIIAGASATILLVLFWRGNEKRTVSL